MTRLTFIVARTSQGVIGLNNQLPWHLPEDLASFKKITMGYPIIMGRKTHESIGRPLPGRLNIIISRNKNYQASGCEVVSNIEEALAYCKNFSDAFLIGGAQLFTAAAAYADRWLITEIHAEFAGDCYLSSPNPDLWYREKVEKIRAALPNEFDVSYIEYLKK